MAELSVPQLRALHAAANWTFCDANECCWFEDHMRTHAGRNWEPTLRRALAEVSRELAKVTKGKR